VSRDDRLVIFPRSAHTILCVLYHATALFELDKHSPGVRAVSAVLSRDGNERSFDDLQNAIDASVDGTATFRSLHMQSYDPETEMWCVARSYPRGSIGIMLSTRCADEYGDLASEVHRAVSGMARAAAIMHDLAGARDAHEGESERQAVVGTASVMDHSRLQPHLAIANPELHRDRWLSHYTRAETAFTHIVPSGALLMNSYQRMRDPIESKHLGFRTDAWQPADEAYDAIARAINAERNRCQLLSFTADAVDAPFDDRWFACSWTRPRMWEQYGENHAGVCLVFDREAVVRQLRMNTTACGQSWDGEVDYSLPGFAGSVACVLRMGDMPLGPSGYARALEERAVAWLHARYRDFFFLKNDDWSAEQEYRFVLRANEDARTLLEYGDSLRAVVLGERFPQRLVKGALDACRQANVALMQISWADGYPRATPTTWKARPPK
jgi:hypothetical protein